MHFPWRRAENDPEVPGAGTRVGWTLTGVLAGGMHLAHAGGGMWGVGLQCLEDGVGGDVGLLRGLLGLRLPVLHRLPPARLVLIIRVVFLVLHTQPLRLLHEGSLLALIQQSGVRGEEKRGKGVSVKYTLMSSPECVRKGV